MKLIPAITLLAVLSTFLLVAPAHARQEDSDPDTSLYRAQLSAKATAEERVNRLQALLAEQRQLVSALMIEEGSETALENANIREARLQGSLDDARIELASAEQELVLIKQRCASCEVSAVYNSPLQATKPAEPPPAAREPERESPREAPRESVPASQGRFRSLSNSGN